MFLSDIEETDSPNPFNLFLPSTGPLPLNSYEQSSSDQDFSPYINPSKVIVHDLHAYRTTWEPVRYSDLVGNYLTAVQWDRLREVVLVAFVPIPRGVPEDWREGRRDLRVTVDLNKLQRKFPAGLSPSMCETTLKRFGNGLGRSRGRIVVDSEDLRARLQLAMEKLKNGEDAKEMGEVLKRVSVEIDDAGTVCRVFLLPVS